MFNIVVIAVAACIFGQSNSRCSCSNQPYVSLMMARQVDSADDHNHNHPLF